jgi:hypothetical protein
MSSLNTVLAAVGIGLALLVAMGGMIFGIGSLGSSPELVSNPAYVWQATPTALPISTSEIANLAQAQLADASGLPVEVSTGEEGEIVIAFTNEVTDTTILRAASTVGGFIELNYTTVDLMTVQMGDATMQVAADNVLAWYNRNLSDEEFLALLQPTEAE